MGLIFSYNFVNAQRQSEIEKREIIENIIEANTEVSEAQDEDLTAYFDELYHFFDHPINLNNTNYDELKSLGLLNDFQINNLLNHLEENGRLITIYEIQAIDGYDLKTIYTILPFVKVSDNFESAHVSIKDMFKNGNQEIFIRNTRTLEEQAGYSPIADSLLEQNPNSRYLGSPDQVYFKYRFKYATNVSFGLVAEKDKGEEFFQGSQPQGFDFYSAHFFLKDIGKIKQFALGDYQVQIGQGLTFWSGRATLISAYTLDVKRNPIPIKPYTSSLEYGYLRGAATNVALGDFEILGFASFKNIDASINSDADLQNDAGGEIGSFSSFSSTGGLHRKQSEIDKKGTLGETIYGGQIAYKKRRIQLGASAVRMLWDATFQADLNTYNQFDFNNNENINVGVNYNYVYKNFNFFGEGARSSSGGMAFVNGALITLDPKLSLAAVYRNYDRDYHIMYRLGYGNGFGSALRTSNEKGLYIGLEAKPVREIIINAYFDRFEYPWIRSSITAPSNGHQYLIQTTYKPNKKFETYLRYRNRVRPVNGNIELIDDLNNGIAANYAFNETGIDPVVASHQHQIRSHLAYKVNDDLTIKSRAEYSRFNKDNEEASQGFMLYQDVIYKPNNRKYEITGRYYLFQTDDFSSRIYVFENTVLYGPPTSFVYGTGSRAYLLIRYKISRKIDFWMRIAQTYRKDVDVLGSGLEQIDGNVRTDVIGQLRFRF